MPGTSPTSPLLQPESFANPSVEIRWVKRKKLDRPIRRCCRAKNRHVKLRLRVMQGPRTTATAWAVIQGIEAAYMIRKGQALGITRNNLHGQAWLFGSLLGVA